MSEMLTMAEISEGALGDEFTVEASIFPESAGESLTNLDLVTTENEESEMSAAKEIATSVGQIACGACVGCPFFNQCVKPQAVAMKQELADQEELSTDGKTDVEEGLVANVADFMPKQSYLEELLAPDDMDEVRETGRGEVIMAGYQTPESQTRIETVQAKVEPRREKVTKDKSTENKTIKPTSYNYQKSEVENVESGCVELKNETTESTIVSHNDLKEVVIDELRPIELDPEITFIDAVRIEDAVDVQLVNDDEGAIRERSLADLAADNVGGTANNVAVEKLVAVDQREKSLGQFDEAAHEIQESPNIITTMVYADFGEEFVNEADTIEKRTGESSLNVVKSATNIEQEKLTIEKPPIFMNELPVAIENAIELEAEFSVKASNSSKNLELASEKPMALATVENQPLKRYEEVDNKAENFMLEKAETNQNLRIAEELDDSSREVADDEIKDKVDVNLIDKEVSDVFSGDFSIVNTAIESVDKKIVNAKKVDDIEEAPLEKDADMIIDNHPEAEAANKGYGLSWLVELVGVVAVFATIGGRSRGLELV